MQALLVWNLASINLAKQKFQIKYGFDKKTYQISKTCAFEFHTRKFLQFFPIWVYVKQVTPGVGPFFTQGL